MKQINKKEEDELNIDVLIVIGYMKLKNQLGFVARGKKIMSYNYDADLSEIKKLALEVLLKNNEEDS